jgi:hypothetical protein
MANPINGEAIFEISRANFFCVVFISMLSDVCGFAPALALILATAYQRESDLLLLPHLATIKEFWNNPWRFWQ